MVLVTENVLGNLHQSAAIINEWGLADEVLTMSYSAGSYTVVVFRMEKDMADWWKKTGKRKRC